MGVKVIISRFEGIFFVISFMSFLYPSFLWALLALAIPIIIHLFYFRRFRKVYFTNVRFLREVKEETSSRTKLKHLLVLISRLLALAMLVFAFAQPFIPQKDSDVKKGRQVVSIFIDNSFSMSSLSEDIPLLEQAKLKAKEIISAYDIEDEFQILTNDFERRHQRLVGQEDALGLVDEVEIGPGVKELSKVMIRQEQALNLSDSENRNSYIISDFQKNITDIPEGVSIDTLTEFSLVPLQSVQVRNISIDSCWFEAPVQMLNQTNPLVVKVRNFSDRDVEDVRLTLSLNDQVRPLGRMSVKAGSFGLDTVNVTILNTGWHEAKLSITDYPVQFDDEYLFAFNVKEIVNVLVINQGPTNKYIDALFKSNPYFNVKNESGGRLDYSKFPENQLIIVNELVSVSSGLASELQQYSRNGGNVLIFPSKNANISSYRSLLSGFNANELESFEETKRGVSYINTEEFVFKDVFENDDANMKLPETQANFKLTRYGSRGEEVLLRYRDGGSFISKYKMDKGNLFLCSAPLDVKYNNLSRSGEIFVPMVYKMALSSGEKSNIAYIIEGDNVLETENRITSNETVYKMAGSGEEFIPEQRNIGARTILGVNNQIKIADFYRLFLQPEKILSVFAFNYDRKESRLDYYSNQDLENLVGDEMAIIETSGGANLTLEIEERKKGVVLWRWCIYLALLFLLIEILLLRLWKT